MNCECGDDLTVYETIPMPKKRTCELLYCKACGGEYVKRTGEPLTKRFGDDQPQCACGFHLRQTGRLAEAGRNYSGPDKVRWLCGKCGTRYGSADNVGSELHALGVTNA